MVHYNRWQNENLYSTADGLTDEERRQIHHRGQVHCLLTQAAVKPEDIDLTIMPDGSNRDSAFYGVIAPEWPSVKARLEGLLDR